MGEQVAARIPKNESWEQLLYIDTGISEWEMTILRETVWSPDQQGSAVWKTGFHQ